MSSTFICYGNDYKYNLIFVDSETFSKLKDLKIKIIPRATSSPYRNRLNTQEVKTDEKGMLTLSSEYLHKLNKNGVIYIDLKVESYNHLVITEQKAYNNRPRFTLATFFPHGKVRSHIFLHHEKDNIVLMTKNKEKRQNKSTTLDSDPATAESE